jgi:hypothetical protein
MNTCRPVLAMFLVAATASAVAAFSGMGNNSKWAGLPASGEVVVTVQYPDGSPASGAKVVAGRKSFQAGRDGIMKTAGIPVAPGVVASEIIRGEGGFLGMFKNKVPYAAFRQVDPKAETPLQLQLKLAPVTSADAACLGCHPVKPTSVNPIIRCAHRSGIPVKQAQVDRVRQFNKENEALLKAGKPAMPPIVLVDNTVKSGFFSKKHYVLACISCHTNHVDTGVRNYVLMPFDSPSTLCRGCHV